MQSYVYSLDFLELSWMLLSLECNQFYIFIIDSSIGLSTVNVDPFMQNDYSQLTARKYNFLIRLDAVKHNTYHKLRRSVGCYSVL